MRQTIFTITIVMSFLITSCATSPTNTQTSVRTKPRLAESTNESVQALLSAAISSSPSKANSLRLEAAEKSVLIGKFDQAENILNLINETSGSRSSINRGDDFSVTLLQTKIAIHRGDANLALQWLASSAITSASLTKSDQMQLA